MHATKPVSLSEKYLVRSGEHPCGLDNFIKVLLPHCQDFDHVAVVESTYNWYCLADVFEERGWLLRLADPSTVSQANLKASDDRTDA